MHNFIQDSVHISNHRILGKKTVKTCEKDGFSLVGATQNTAVLGPQGTTPPATRPAPVP
jgi:hypothetical protein